LAIISALGQNGRKIRAKSSLFTQREREKGSLIEMGGVEGKVVVVYGNKRQGEKREEAQNPPTTKKKQSRPTENDWELEPSDDEKRGEKQEPPIVFYETK
jgi:hypothetical protein